MPEPMTDALIEWLKDPEHRALMEEELAAISVPPAPDSNGGNRGRVDPRNQLNDMTGAEWVFFLNSLESTCYPTTGPEGYAHRIRRIHPSPKPPQLMARLIRFFTKQGEWVLDPFAGVGGTLLGCSLAGRNGVGIELDTRYINAYKEACAETGLAHQTLLAGDARNIKSLVPDSPERYDFVLTDPPYGDLLSRARTGETLKKTGKAKATPFTDSRHDLGNLSREEFLKTLQAIIADCRDLLKPRGHCVVFAKDMQPVDGSPNMLHAEIADRLARIPGLSFRGYRIWHDRTPRLYPFGYPYTFVANQLHQFILVFRREG